MVKRFAPATERNSTPIWEVLKTVLPKWGDVLEIASGTGQHAVFFAPMLPGIRWQPTDGDPEALAGIEAWRLDAGTSNLAPALLLDVTRRPWPVERADAIVCCNMIHIAPWDAAENLFAGASEVLAPGGPLFLYGPFIQSGVETAPSNLAFDASLKERNPAWGIRHLDDVTRLAGRHGLRFERKVAMPANNLSVVFSRR